MAIIKTSPPPYMTVGDYRDAALQHLDTCKILWRYVKLPTQSNLKRLSEEKVLKNIFYLTGYVAECAIKYRYLTDCFSLNDSDAEPHWTSPSVRAHVKKHLTFVTTSPRDKTWSEHVIQALSASSSARPVPPYLQIVGKVIVPTSTSSIEEDMQASWEPTTRYHYPTNGLPFPPNKSDIEVFYQSTILLLRNFSII